MKHRLAIALFLFGAALCTPARAFWSTAPNQVLQMQQVTVLQSQIGFPTGVTSATTALGAAASNPIATSGYVPPQILDQATTGLDALAWTDNGIYNPAPKALPTGPPIYDPMTYRQYGAMERQVDDYHVVVLRAMQAQEQISLAMTALAQTPVVSVIDGLTRIVQQQYLMAASQAWWAIVQTKALEISNRHDLNEEERWKRSLIDRDNMNASYRVQQAAGAATDAIPRDVRP